MYLRKCAAMLLALVLSCAPAMAQARGLSGLIEGQLSWYAFTPMPEAALALAVEALGGIADAYRFTGRVSADGTYGYMLGELVAEVNLLAGLQTNYYSTPDGEEVQGLWPRDLCLTDPDAPEPTYSYKDVRLIFAPDMLDTIIVVPGKYVKFDYYALYYAVVYGNTAYLEDMTARGVYMCAPPVPCLLVRHFVNGEHRNEYIRLTREDVENAMFSSYLYTPDIIGDYALTLFTQEGIELGGQKDVGVTAPLFDLAAQKCGFYTASPEDIGEIVLASIVVMTYKQTRTQIVDDPKQLAQLAQILKNAKYSGLYGCPYKGVLTLTMADGSEVVIHKAVDSCGTLVFGSAAGYQIDRKENAQFWEIFSDAALQ